MIRFPPEKILVACDLSDVSRTAWRHASALAARCGAALEVVYVEPWDIGVDALPPPEPTPAHLAALRAEVRAVVGSGAKVTVLNGDPADRILDWARRHRPDLIVVGTHGRKGLKLALLGSVAETIIRSSPVPVLAARGPVRAIRAILAPVNFTAYSDYGFAYAAAAAAALRARLKVLHVTDDPVWSGNLGYRLSVLLKRLPARVLSACRPSTLTAVGEAVPGILKARRGQDWIVLVTHEKSLIKDAFFGTTLEQVLRRSPVPVLSVPAPARPLFALKVSGGRSEAREKSLTLR